MTEPKDKDDSDDGGRFPIEPETRSRPHDDHLEHSKKDRDKKSNESDDD